MKVHGKCLCGDITFTAEVDENSARICHCTDCQINSASAFGTAACHEPLPHHREQLVLRPARREDVVAVLQEVELDAVQRA